MWSEVGERSLFGPDMIKDVEEQVAKVRENLKAAQSRQKSYADTRQKAIRIPTRRLCLSKSITNWELRDSKSEEN
jgi:hypothetical protein